MQSERQQVSDGCRSKAASKNCLKHAGVGIKYAASPSRGRCSPDDDGSASRQQQQHHHPASELLNPISKPATLLHPAPPRAAAAGYVSNLDLVRQKAAKLSGALSTSFPADVFGIHQQLDWHTDIVAVASWASTCMPTWVLPIQSQPADNVTTHLPDRRADVFDAGLHEAASGAGMPLRAPNSRALEIMADRSHASRPLATPVRANFAGIWGLQEFLPKLPMLPGTCRTGCSAR